MSRVLIPGVHSTIRSAGKPGWLLAAAASAAAAADDDGGVAAPS